MPKFKTKSNLSIRLAGVWVKTLCWRAKRQSLGGSLQCEDAVVTRGEAGQ